MPVCKITRAARCRRFEQEAGYSYCAAKDERYYGFEGHLVVSEHGIPCAYTFAAANIDERDIVPEMVEGLTGLLIGDKGYIRPQLRQTLLKEQQLDLQTPLRKNMTDDRDKEQVSALMVMRKRIESVIAQLTERFHIEKVWAKDCWHQSGDSKNAVIYHGCIPEQTRWK